MGATRESSWSDGIFEVGDDDEDCPAGGDCVADARVSPGIIAIAHKIASRDRMFAASIMEPMDFSLCLTRLLRALVKSRGTPHPPA